MKKLPKSCSVVVSSKSPKTITIKCSSSKDASAVRAAISAGASKKRAEGSRSSKGSGKYNWPDTSEIGDKLPSFYVKTLNREIEQLIEKKRPKVATQANIALAIARTKTWLNKTGDMSGSAFSAKGKRLLRSLKSRGHESASSERRKLAKYLAQAKK